MAGFGLDEYDERVLERALAGEISWAEASERLHQGPAWYEIYETHPRDREAWRKMMPPKPQWHAGASTDEVLAFRLAPGYESAVQALDDGELIALLAVAVGRSENPGSRTPWLVRYTGLLVGERHRRRGAA